MGRYQTKGKQSDATEIDLKTERVGWERVLNCRVCYGVVTRGVQLHKKSRSRTTQPTHRAIAFRWHAQTKRRAVFLSQTRAKQ